jgi:hypothetical protein
MKTLDETLDGIVIAMSKKRIDIAWLKNKINAYLKNSNNLQVIERVTLISLLEVAMKETNSFEGFEIFDENDYTRRDYW